MYDIENKITDKLRNRYARLLWRSSPSIEMNLAGSFTHKKYIIESEEEKMR